MLKLYGPTNRLSINTLKIRVALHETGAAYEYIPVDLAAGQQRNPQFLALNPHGKVPVLMDGSFVLPESDAILWYVAESFPEAGLLGEGTRVRARTLEWCDFASAGTYPASYDLQSHTVSLPPEKRVASVAEGARQRLVRSLKVLETVLGTRPWLVDGYSIADIGNAAVLRILRERAPELFQPLLPALEDWYRRVSSRPAWKSVVEAK